MRYREHLERIVPFYGALTNPILLDFLRNWIFWATWNFVLYLGRSWIFWTAWILYCTPLNIGPLEIFAIFINIRSFGTCRRSAVAYLLNCDCTCNLTTLPLYDVYFSKVKEPLPCQLWNWLMMTLHALIGFVSKSYSLWGSHQNFGP